MLEKQVKVEIIMKLSCFQEGNDGQEDLVVVEKKEELIEEANLKIWW